MAGNAPPNCRGNPEANLNRGFDQPGAPGTFINVNFGNGLPAPAVAAAQTPRAVIYNPPAPANALPAGWNWSAANRVNFICHSQGGTTVRYLIELLSGAHPNPPQFFGVNRQPWIKSVVTLGTPHKGTTVTGVVNVSCPVRELSMLDNI
jgi:hypothetical protein